MCHHALDPFDHHRAPLLGRVSLSSGPSPRCTLDGLAGGRVTSHRSRASRPRPPFVSRSNSLTRGPSLFPGQNAKARESTNQHESMNRRIAHANIIGHPQGTPHPPAPPGPLFTMDRRRAPSSPRAAAWTVAAAVLLLCLGASARLDAAGRGPGPTHDPEDGATNATAWGTRTRGLLGKSDRIIGGESVSFPPPSCRREEAGPRLREGHAIADAATRRGPVYGGFTCTLR